MNFKESNIKLPENGKIILFTDGFFEVQKVNGERFSITEFYQQLREYTFLDSQDTINETVKFIESIANEKQKDDRNLIVIRRK